MYIKLKLITGPTFLALSHQQHKISPKLKSLIYFILFMLDRCKLEIFREQNQLCRSSQHYFLDLWERHLNVDMFDLKTTL